MFDSNDKIKEIWFLRQLSHDELESKVRKSSAAMHNDERCLHMGACIFQLSS